MHGSSQAYWKLTQTLFYETWKKNNFTDEDINSTIRMLMYWEDPMYISRLESSDRRFFSIQKSLRSLSVRMSFFLCQAQQEQ